MRQPPPQSSPSTDDILVRKALEEVQRQTAAAFAHVEAMEEKIAEFAHGREAVAKEMREALTQATDQLDFILPAPGAEQEPNVAIEFDRLRERRAALSRARSARESAVAELSSLATAMGQSRADMSSFNAALEGEPTRLHDWFYAPAARAGLGQGRLSCVDADPGRSFDVEST